MFISLQPRDPSYVPDTEGVNGRVRYGDLVLVLKKKEVRQEYIMSLLEVKDIEVRTQYMYLENTTYLILLSLPLLRQFLYLNRKFCKYSCKIAYQL